MNYIDITGSWVNEFGSTMTIQSVDPNTGIFYGTYQSHTGATGIYHLTGITDISPAPDVNSQTISFSISWRSFQGTNDESQYWVSAFSGQVQRSPAGIPMITSTYLLQHNTNPADNWGSTIVATSIFKPKTSAKQQIQSQVSALKSSTNSISFPLRKGKITDNGATPWVAAVGIGTPAQTLSLMIDTGTDNTWVTSAACTTTACQAHERFNADKSSSFSQITTTPTEKDFGPWGKMWVVIGEDVWHFPNTDVTEAMNFELSVDYSGRQFADLVADGGIAIPGPYWHTSDKNTESLMVQLLKDGKLGYAAAAFWTDPQTGQGGCTFGAVEPDKYAPNTLQWISLQNDYDSPLNYLWQIPLQSLTFDGTPTQAQISAFVLDTGSSYFKGPQDLINTLRYEATRNGTLPTFVTNYEALSAYPNMVLSLGSQQYELKPEQYFLQTGVSYWEIGIQVLDGMPEGMLLVGSMFLDTVYSIFDLQASCIGLARRV